jgi:uncharacterized protein (DUF885 family)
MAKTLRVVAGLFGLGLVAALVVAVNAVWFRPWSLDVFYEKIFVSFALERPELLSMLGVAEQLGYRRHNAHLDDVSVAHQLSDAVRWRRYALELREYPLDRQTPSQRLSTRILRWYLDNLVDGERFAFHDYPVNQLDGVQSTTVDLMLNVHRIPDRRGALDYLSRLSEFGRKFDQVVDGLRHREEKGVVPPRFVVERVLEELRADTAVPPAENVLQKNLVAKLEPLADLSAEEKKALAERSAQLIGNVVYPAFRRLSGFLQGQAPRAGRYDGLWAILGGSEYYVYKLRTSTTTLLTPEQIHELGLTEVARIEGELRTHLDALGHHGGTPAGWLAKLAKDPRFLYANDEAGRSQALADYSRMIDLSLERARDVIGLQPRARIEVRRVPEFKERTSPAGYYQMAALDGTRPGVFYVNLRDMGEVPKLGMRTLSVHEGVPGHHFQLSAMQELRGVPTFRRVLPFTAFTEGWALYAEWLGQELGVYRDDPYGDLGRLQAELFRAVRLVVDTGIHFKQWTRQQAEAYMIAQTGMGEAEVVTEVERYVVDPGQACAYKIGMLKLQELRTRAEQALGARFDRKAFHDLVLGEGAMPLEVLDERVNRWIAERATRD